jgi:hypothetical protein
MRIFVSALPLVLFASQTAFAGVDSTLVGMAPSASTILAGIDVVRAATSPSGVYILKQIVADQNLTKLVDFTGLDVRRDMRHMLIVGLGRQANLDSPDAVIADGTFNPSRLVAAARSRGAFIRQYQGLTIIVQGTGKTVAGISFPRPGVLIMGKLPAVETVLASAVFSASLDPSLQEQVSRIGSTNDFWYATILPGPSLIRQIGNVLPSQLRNSEALGAIIQSSGGLQFGHPDKITLNLVERSTGDAQLLNALLRVASGVAQLQFGGDAALVVAESALSSMRVTDEGSMVQAMSSIPDAQLARALASGN